MTSASGALIRVESLRHTYGATTVVHDVSFSVAAGEICGYLGPNGAGKTTTVSALAGVLAPSGGGVWIAGHSLADEPLRAKRALGYVPDHGGLYPLLSAREHIELLADLHELEARAVAERVSELSARFEITGVLDRPVESLSKGQRQKVALVCGLVHRPQVIVLDEPLDGVDVASAAELKDILEEAVGAGACVLLSSHLLDVAERWCHRAIVLANGRVLADRAMSDLCSGGATLTDAFRALTRDSAAAPGAGAP